MFARAFVVSAAMRSSQGQKIRKALVRIGSAMALVLAASSAAQAQQCAFTGIVPAAGSAGVARLVGFAATMPGAIGAAITTANTAFLAQTTAFIASPRGSQPDQFAGGIWVRGVGGRLDIDSRAAGTSSVSAAPAVAGTLSCETDSKNYYAGFQAGIDIGRLAIGNSGWNAHLGVTAGYLEIESLSRVTTNRTESPFVGIYAALTSADGFYVDAQIRKDFFKMSITDPGVGLRGAALDADGWGITASAGRVFSLGDVIIEPSVGVVYSRTSVDPLAFTTVFGAAFPPAPGVLRVQDIETLLGRAGIRIGTTVSLGNLIVQPFAAASIWHEFADKIVGSYQTQCAPAVCLLFGGVPTEFGAVASGDRIGTFGQYSVGAAATIPETRWLGYLRFDYRNGARVDGYGVNGGIRFQFAP